MLSGSQKRSLSLSPDKATRLGTPTRREESVSAARAPACEPNRPLSGFLPAVASFPQRIRMMYRTSEESFCATRARASGERNSCYGLRRPRRRDGEGSVGAFTSPRLVRAASARIVRLASASLRSYSNRRRPAGTFAHPPELRISSWYGIASVRASPSSPGPCPSFSSGP